MAFTPSPGRHLVLDRVLREYNPATDHRDLVDLCRDVFNGTDYLPTVINGYAALPEFTILVIESLQPPRRIDGLICTEVRGRVLWIFGARVDPPLRRKGIGTMLLEAAIQVGRDKGLFAALSSTHSGEGGISNCFNKCGMRRHATVEVWPSNDALKQAAERQRHEGAGAGPPPSLTLIDIIPNAAELLRTEAAQELLPHWVRCNDVLALREAVEYLQGMPTDSNFTDIGSYSSSPTRTSDSVRSSPCSAGRGGTLPGWLPHMHAALPVNWKQVAQWVEEGKAWILPPEEGSGSVARGVLILAPSEELHGVVAAGIRAETTPAVESAMLKAYTMHPDFRVCVHQVGYFHEQVYAFECTNSSSFQVHFILL